MRGLYLCSGQNLSDNTSGITKKINSQLLIFKENGINIDIINIDNYTSILDKILFFTPFVFSKYQKRQIQALAGYDLKNYDFIYIRKFVLSAAFLKLLKYIRKENHNIKIVMEIPTYPINGEYKGIERLLLIPALTTSYKLKKYIDKIITYSDDNMIWGIDTIKISNCVDFSIVRPRNIKYQTTNNEINVIAVALFSHWHGYDRFIEGMHKYYNLENNCKRKIIKLHLVGDSEILKTYKKMVEKYHLEENIIFYGKQFGRDLDKIYDKCELALDALARHRSKVYYNSSLKGKEYGAKGLPIISGVKTELDSDPTYKYYLKISSDDSAVDIEKVIEFYETTYEKNIDKREIIDQIRKYSKEKFEYSKEFKKIISYIRT